MNCPTCQRELRIMTAKTERNFGRHFVSCREHKFFEWIGDAQIAAIHDARATVDRIISSVPPLRKPTFDNDTPLTGSDEATSESPENGNKNKSNGEGSSEPISGAGLGYLAQLDEDAPNVPVVKKQFTPSSYQVAIRDFVIGDSRNLQIKAYAGSGKTSTNAWVTSFIPEKSIDCAMMVFSKANQLDMEKKIPSWIPATTTHSAGLADIRRAFGNRVKVDENNRKMWNLLKEEYSFDYDVRDNGAAILHLVSLCKNSLREPNRENLDYLCERFDVLPNGNAEMIYDAVATLYRKSLERHDVIAFDDMLAMPALGIVPVAKHELLFVDEYQDNNEAQKTYYLETGARIVYVGDDFQSIYGFRGAMLGAMAEMQKLLNAESLSLPISYRCPRAVIQLAQTLVPEIQARDNAPDGLVKDIPMLTGMRSGDMVLCRLNAPLVKPCFELIRAGIKATIKGRDIGQGLITFTREIQKKFGSSDLRAMLVDMQNYVDNESAKLIATHRESQAAMLQDQAETILALSDGCNSTSDLESRIGQVFTDQVQDVVFSTVHKAKGLEAERVFIIKPEVLQPQKFDKADWQLEQLRNLNYVAWTRSAGELYFVRSA